MLWIPSPPVSVSWPPAQLCTPSLFIAGSALTQTGAESYQECREQCQHTARCQHWRYKTGWSSCVLLHNQTYHKTNEKYISGSGLCTSPGKRTAWGENIMQYISLATTPAPPSYCQPGEPAPSLPLPCSLRGGCAAG